MVKVSKLGVPAVITQDFAGIQLADVIIKQSYIISEFGS